VSESVQLVEDSQSATRVLETYRVAKNVFLLGCLSSGVTIHKQQVRAHNLAYAMACLYGSKASKRIAVIGGGVAGLTFVAALMSLLPEPRLRKPCGT
jgi:hypothetical protein